MGDHYNSILEHLTVTVYNSYTQVYMTEQNVLHTFEKSCTLYKYSMLYFSVENVDKTGFQVHNMLNVIFFS